jgi:ribose transport system substrate-binding protein
MIASSMRIARTTVGRLVPALLLLLGGCRAHSDLVPMISIIPKSTSTLDWKTVHAAVRQQLKTCDCKVSWNAPESEADYPLQASMVDDAVAHHVSGIILAPSHQLVLASSVRNANEHGIPVVLIDSPIALPPSQYAAMIGFNDEEIGFLAADRIGKLLNGVGDVGVVGVSPTLEGSSAREDAFMHELKERYPGIKVVEIQYGLSDWARSSRAAEDLLDHHKTLQAIFASDSFAASGAADTLKHHPERHVSLVAVGEEGDILNGVRDGFIDSTVVKDSYAMGDVAMKTMMDVLHHKPVRAYTSLSVRLITKTEVDLFQSQQDRILHGMPANTQ